MVVICANCLSAQSPPQGISWQTIVRNLDGSLIQNQLVGVRIDLHQGSPTGTVVYSEAHADTSDEFGLINLVIGSGTSLTGQFNSIDWSNGPFFTEILSDPTGGTNYLSMGWQQMLSVPYAMYSGQSLVDLVDDADADPANELQVISISDDTVMVSNGGFIVLPFDPDTDSTNEIELPTGGQVGQVLTLCDDGPTWGPCPSCSDGIQNRDETGIDCGGTYCSACPGPSTCGNTITDPRDGQTYATVQIGNQCWMAENLNYGTIVTSISTGGTHSNQTDTSLAEKYCFGNITANCALYGGMYEWRELMQQDTGSTSNPSGVQGLCPPGWHVPSDAEWMEMEIALGMDVNEALGNNRRGTDQGGQLKEAGTANWSSPNEGATNSSGFTALPGGRRFGGGGFVNDAANHVWIWTATEFGPNGSWFRKLDTDNDDVFRYHDTKYLGNYCRCVKD